MKVVILAGGLGTRLKPFKNILPKPLLPFRNKTIIENVITKFTNYGLMFEDLLLNTESNIFDIENYNHVSINLIILTGLICIITRNFEI